MRRRTGLKRVNYKQLHETGEKVYKLSDETSDKTLNMDNLIAEIETLSLDINDFIEENQISNDIWLIDDIQNLVDKISDLRSVFRNKHKLLKQLCTNYDEDHLKSYDDKLTQIKEFITSANDIKHKQRMKEFLINQEKQESRNTQMNFLVEDANRLMNEIDVEIGTNLSKVTDENITRRKSELQLITKKLNLVSTKISEILKFEGGIKVAPKKRYDALIYSVENYENEVNSENSKREISKEMLFKESKLNIKLPKFCGYETAIDIYTFQMDFEKIYGKTTPKRLMPDILKNNLLGDPALSLVKSCERVDGFFFGSNLKRRLVILK